MEIESGSIESTDTRIKTLTKFRLPVLANTNYEIIIDINKVHKSSTTLCPTGTIRTNFLNSTGDFDTVSGSLGTERTHIVPYGNGTLDLVVVADGNLNHEY